VAALSIADLSAEQREIWQAEQDYWLLTRERDVEGFLALAHDRITVWPHIAPSPIDRPHLRDVQRAREPIAAYEIDFHSIEVHGDAAIVYYTVVTNGIAPAQGVPTKRAACITHTWVKYRGSWRLAGGMSRPGNAFASMR
jgi:ketosteroid isomerase-like protein